MTEPIKNISELTQREWEAARVKVEATVKSEVDTFLKGLPAKIGSALEQASVSMLGLKKEWNGWQWDNSNNGNGQFLKKIISHHAEKASEPLVAGIIAEAAKRIADSEDEVRQMMITTYIRAYREALKQALRHEAEHSAKKAVEKLMSLTVPALTTEALFKNFDPAAPVDPDDAFKVRALEMKVATGELKV